MNQSTFWHGRRTLVLGATGFLGSRVVQALIQRGAAVTALVRDSRRPSEFFAARLHQHARVVRGPADPLRLRNLLAVTEPAVVFQLATPGKGTITGDLLRAAAVAAPDASIVVPVSPAERDPRFSNHSPLRVGFVKLPTLFGEGDRRDAAWPGRLFTAAAEQRPLPRPTDDAPLTYVGDAANSLLAAAELLAALPEQPADGLRLDPRPTTTAARLFDRVSAPLGLAGDRLAAAVRSTIDWYRRQPARDTDVSATRAA